MQMEGLFKGIIFLVGGTVFWFSSITVRFPWSSENSGVKLLHLIIFNWNSWWFKYFFPEPFSKLVKPNTSNIGWVCIYQYCTQEIAEVFESFQGISSELLSLVFRSSSLFTYYAYHSLSVGLHLWKPGPSFLSSHLLNSCLQSSPKTGKQLCFLITL
jgi:hypothetical protein